MRTISVFLGLMLLSLIAQAQLNPVSWSFEAKKVSADAYDLIITAKIEKGWYVYSQYLESDEGPIPTHFTFAIDDDYRLAGETLESGNKKEGFDEIFGMNLAKFSTKAVFTQRVNLLRKTDRISGSVEFMTCNDEQCLPPETIAFSIMLK